VKHATKSFDRLPQRPEAPVVHVLMRFSAAPSNARACARVWGRAGGGEQPKTAAHGRSCEARFEKTGGGHGRLVPPRAVLPRGEFGFLVAGVQAAAKSTTGSGAGKDTRALLDTGRHGDAPAATVCPPGGDRKGRCLLRHREAGCEAGLQRSSVKPDAMTGTPAPAGRRLDPAPTRRGAKQCQPKP